MCGYPAHHRRFGRIPNCPASGEKGESHQRHYQQRPGQGVGETYPRRYAVLVPRFVGSPGRHQRQYGNPNLALPPQRESHEAREVQGSG